MSTVFHDIAKHCEKANVPSLLGYLRLVQRRLRSTFCVLIFLWPFLTLQSEKSTSPVLVYFSDSSHCTCHILFVPIQPPLYIYFVASSSVIFIVHTSSWTFCQTSHLPPYSFRSICRFRTPLNPPFPVLFSSFCIAIMISLRRDSKYIYPACRVGVFNFGIHDETSLDKHRLELILK